MSVNYSLFYPYENFRRKSLCKVYVWEVGSYAFPSSEQIIHINYMEFHMEGLSFLPQSSIYWIIISPPLISVWSQMWVFFFFFLMSLLSGTITLFQAHLVSPFLSPKNNYFSRMSRSFYWRVVLETYLSATCVYC